MTIDEINQKLIDRYGKDLYGNPKYRVVWSNGQTEKRVGVFNEFYGKIFIRQVSGLREVRKYPYIQDRWVLEKSFPNPYRDEVESNITFEPIWTFSDFQGNYVYPEWRAIELLIYWLENPVKLTPGQLDSIEEDKFLKEIDYFENYLAGDSWIQNALATREAIVVPNKEQ